MYDYGKNRKYNGKCTHKSLKTTGSRIGFGPLRTQNIEFHSTFSRLGNQKTPFHCPRLNENVLYTPYLSVCFKYLLPIRL